jgi:3-oxoacyl-[acyl-carrier protein] reductase
MLTLKGRTCVFAGASGGDGVAAVKALCREGMNVVMMTHQLSQAQDLIREIETLGYEGSCKAYMDGNCYEPPKTDAQVYQEIFEEMGSIDVIISNTGGPENDDSIDSVDVKDLMRDVEHLLGGSYGMLKSALPYLRQSKAPRVIFMTTVEGVRGGKNEGLANAIAKGAVNAMMKNCAARLMEEGITVNAISKGAILRTADCHVPRPGEPKHKEPEDKLPLIPAGRLGTPEDLAGAICYLASEESGYVTGTRIDLAGGLQLV